MNFGEAEIVREEGNIRLLKIGCRNDKISFVLLEAILPSILMIMMMLWKNLIFVG